MLNRLMKEGTPARAAMRRSGGILLGLAALGLLACGPDREKLAKDVQDKVRADMDRKIKAEVERRLKAELPRLEARLRARLTGRKLVPPRRGSLTPPDGTTPRPAMPPGPVGPDGKSPAAVPADAMEAKAPDVDPEGLEVKRVVLVKKVVDRKPEGEGTAFTLADGRVYCYIDAKNPKGPERMLRVVWHHNGKAFHQVRLRVGKGHVWRTWAYVRLRKSHVGNWRCGVFNEKNELIRSASFTVAE